MRYKITTLTKKANSSIMDIDEISSKKVEVLVSW